MSHTKILLGISTLLLSTLACVTLMGTPAPETDSTSAPVTEEAVVTSAPVDVPTTESIICTDLTDQIMSISTSSSDSVDDSTTSPTSDESTLLATYAVDGDQISDPSFESVSSDLQSLQEDTQTQQEVWDYFTQLIPLENRSVISEYSIDTDGVDNVLASVAQTETDANQWALTVDLADTSDYYSLTFTLVHEFGHLLTLGPDQVPPSEAIFNNPDDNDIYLKEVSACPNYFPGEGCANSDAYINAFYDQFWTDIHDEWNEINLEEDETVYYDKLDAFYQKYQDQFVTDYAPTNPEEDIAESWAFFVLGPKPEGNTIAEEKVLFFYQYPELVQLRAHILNNLCTAFPQ
ncbi:MAG: hypothetical protein U0Z26_00690 [Anaerolineales bacterium]